MKKTALLCILLFTATAFSQTDKAQLALFKKEAASISGAIDDIVNGAIPGRGFAESTKATYLEGYGAVFTLEASLEPTRNPFTSIKAPAEVRAIVAERRKAIEAKLQALLKERAGVLQSVGSAGSVTVVLYLFNSNPVDVPDLPSQIILTVKKSDPSQVAVQAF